MLILLSRTTAGDKIRQNRLRWFGHVIRRRELEVVSTIILTLKKEEEEEDR